MPDYSTQLKENGITANSDGLLKDFIARGLYTAARDAARVSIERRYTEIEFLIGLRADLQEQIEIDKAFHEDK